MSPAIYLRPPTLADQQEFLAAVRKSRALHRPWIKPASSPAQFKEYIERMALPTNIAFMVCRSDDDCIVGVVNISNIVRSLFRSGYLGFYVFSGYEQQGYMRKALKAAVRHAFITLKLHRLEANIQPGNAKSIALVASCGFVQEGMSPRYLKIAGKWRDHERWAILAS